MFFEADRLQREDYGEGIMPAEQFPCSKCGRMVQFSADLDTVIVVTCKNCGKEVEAVIEKPKRKAA
jgi:transcription elongation factor Elf1